MYGYKMSSEDQTEDLEQEKLEGAVEDQDDDEPDARSDGQLFHAVLTKRGLIKSSWSDLSPTMQAAWDTAADDLGVDQVREDMIDELD